MSPTHDEKKVLERTWLNAALPDSRWKRLNHTCRTGAYAGRMFVLWEVRPDGTPQLLDLYRINDDIAVSWTAGISLQLQSAQTGEVLRITSMPCELAPDVYIWIPAFAEARFTPCDYANAESAKRLTLAVCVRTSTEHLTPATRHLTALQDFERAWPGIF